MKVYMGLTPKEKNTQKRDIFSLYRSNSQNHYKNISDFSYEHRIKLNPLGEHKTMDIRNQIPTSHIHDSFIKLDYLNYKTRNNKNAYENADIESKINSHLKKQKYQNLLENEKDIKQLCIDKNKEIKKQFVNKKNKLKEQLTTIIKDALKFSNKNNPVRAMLPDNINEIVEKAKKETQDLSLTLNISHISKISRASSVGIRSSIKKNEFLNLLGVDVENLNVNNVNIDIDKCWNYIVQLSKGRKIEDILRYKVVNEIMSITEKKSSEKAKKLYEKLNIYKKYMARKKYEEKLRKKLEEEKKKNIFLKTNTKEFIKSKMKRSLSQPKMFNKELNLEDKKNKKRRPDIRKRNIKTDRTKMKRCESENTNMQKKVIRFNAYNDINRIIDFIDHSRNNSQSKICREHFANIQMAKDFNNSMPKMINKNYITYK